MESIVKQIAEGKNIWLIFFSCAFALIFNINNIYDFLDKASKRKLFLMKDFLGDKGVSGTTKDAIQEELNSQAFQYVTGINTNSDTRQKMIKINKLTNGRISYSDFKRAYKFIVNRDGKLLVRVSLIDRLWNIFAWIGAIVYLGLGLTLLLAALFFPLQSPKQPYINVIVILFSFLALLSAFSMLSETIPLFIARKIRDELRKNPKLLATESKKGDISQSYEIIVPNHSGLWRDDYQMPETTTLTKQFIEERDKGYWIRDSRISLDSIVYSFINGESPESIVQNFPLLSLEQVYAAIAFYLNNQEKVDNYLKKGRVEFTELQQSCRQGNPLLYQNLKLAQAEKQKLV